MTPTRRFFPAACAILAALASVLLAASAAMAEPGARGVFGIALGMTRAEIGALGHDLVPRGAAAPDGRAFLRLEARDPAHSLDLTFAGEGGGLVELALGWADRRAPSPLPPSAGLPEGFAFGETKLGDIETRYATPGHYYRCRPFDIVEGAYIFTTAWFEDGGATAHIYVTEVSPLLVNAGAVDPAFELSYQSVLVGIIIADAAYPTTFWCPQLVDARWRPPVPEVLVERLDRAALRAENAPEHPLAAWDAEPSRWQYDPEFDFIAKHGSVVYGEILTFGLSEDCENGRFGLFLAMTASAPSRYATGERLGATMGVVSVDGLLPMAGPLTIVTISAHDPTRGWPFFDYLQIDAGAAELELLRAAAALAPFVYGIEIDRGAGSPFQSRRNGWDFSGFAEAADVATKACRRRGAPPPAGG